MLQTYGRDNENSLKNIIKQRAKNCYCKINKGFFSILSKFLEFRFTFLDISYIFLDSLGLYFFFTSFGITIAYIDMLLTNKCILIYQLLFLNNRFIKKF